MSLKRSIDWPEKMHDFIEGHASKPFAWGTNDCALFVCDHIQNITGTDVATEFRDKYTDKSGAFATIASVTKGKTVEDAADYITKKFALTELASVKLAQRGDVVIFDGSEDGPALGLVNLNGVHALFVGEEGLKRTRLSLCRRAWRVG